MSRTKKVKADQGFALLTLKCPAGHKLGQVLKQPLLPVSVVSGPGWLSASPLSSPLAMRCHKCRALGIRHDLRGSWDKIKVLLAEIEEDPTRGREEYVLGG